MKIIIPIDIYQKMRAYVNAVDTEISGLGKIISIEDFEGDITFAIEDVKIFEQVVSGGNTEVDKKALACFYDDLIQAGEDPSLWKLWWHSHAQMGTFWSETDENTIEDFDNETEKDNWFLSLVTNLDREILTRLDIFSPFRIKKEEIPYEIIFDDAVISEEIRQEVKDKVKDRKWNLIKKENKFKWPPEDKKEGIVHRIFSRPPATDAEIIIEGLQGQNPRGYDD